MQCAFVNRFLHPVLRSTLIPINDAVNSCRTMCPVNTIGRPEIVMSHICVDLTLLPSGRLMVSRVVAGHKFSTGVPSLMNMDVPPVSAIASVVATVIALRY